MNKKVAIYCRVSKHEQNPKHQEKSLIKYAQNYGFTIYKIYTDYSSGAKQSRPSLNEMMFDLREKKFDVLLIWKLDRLGRSLKHLLNILNELEIRHIDLICTTQNIDTTNAMGKLFFHIAGAFAEFERELISERTKEGLKHAKNVGKRGKDKKPRRKSGYWLRWERQKKGKQKTTPPFLDGGG